MTIAAVNNAADVPDTSVDVTATVAGGNGVAAPGKQTLTIRDDDPLRRWRSRSSLCGSTRAA